MNTYQQWIEQFGAPGTGMPSPLTMPQQVTTKTPGIAEPQHQIGEDEMDVSQVIERRLQMLIDELEKKKRLPRTQLVQVLSQVVQTLGGLGMSKSMANQAVKSNFPGPANASASPSAQPQITA